MTDKEKRRLGRRPRALGKQLVQTVMPLRLKIGAISWRDLAVTLGPFVIAIVILVGCIFWFLDPAPPSSITFSAGPEGSSFEKQAEQYKKILARNGVKVTVLTSEGALENLHRLQDPNAKVDVAFVLDGVAQPGSTDGLVSLGSVAHQPLFVFYRADHEITSLAEFEGKHISIGPIGSGARVLATAILKGNGIEQGGDTQLRGLEGEDAVQDLLDGEIQAALLMGDSARPELIRKLLFTPDIRLMSFSQAEAYTKRFAYLNALHLPMGAIDLGKNIPAANVDLIAPTVELVARSHLHPALSDLLIEAAREVHGHASVLQHAGDYPAPQSSDFTLSDDATRYYHSGKSLLFRHLPFWLASLVDRILIIIVPIVLVALPGLRLVPWMYQWRIRSRIFRWYGALLALEQAAMAEPSGPERDGLLARLDEIEAAVHRLNVPLAFADQLYVLRQHVSFVRERLEAGETSLA